MLRSIIGLRCDYCTWVWMGEYSREQGTIRELLADGESVGIEIRESRLGGGRLLAPAHVFATEHRIIIVRRDALGIRNSIKIIRYEHITEIKIERGMSFCRLHFSLIGEQAESAEDMKWVSGLYYHDALKLIQFINRRHFKPVAENEHAQKPESAAAARPLRPLR